MKQFQCTHCAQRVFFENTACESCHSQLGYVPAERAMVAFGTGGQTWNRLGPAGPVQRPCANYINEGVCNWMVADDDSNALCLSCRTTRIIPALSRPENRSYWGSLEQAKRRLLYSLFSLGLPVPDKGHDPAHGLAFRFLEETGPQERVMTGHDNGVITLNIAEANDAAREKARLEMREPYRSLVGHFRHESGHFYWDRLVKDTSWIDEYRAVFGDERRDYGAALQVHYGQPLADWHLSFVSAYASSHPWEDWAECWAHYLHVIDGLETAAAWGLCLAFATPDGAPVQAFPVDLQAGSMKVSLLQQWLPVAQFTNAMNRSLGLQDSYPFVMPSPVVAKLEFIHRVVRAAVHGEVPMNFSSPPGPPAPAGAADQPAAPPTMPAAPALVMAPVGKIETDCAASDGGYHADPLYMDTAPHGSS